MRIAYVEDNPTNLALVERVVSMGQHKIISYTEGEIAVQELTREKFDLILMDVELAGDIGGLEVVKQLRAYGLKTPIVAVTAYAMSGDRDRCIEAGCNDYLPKPIPITELIKLLARYAELAATKRQTDELPKLEPKPAPAAPVLATTPVAAPDKSAPPVAAPATPSPATTPVFTTPVVPLQGVPPPQTPAPVVSSAAVPASGEVKPVNQPAVSVTPVPPAPVVPAVSPIPAVPVNSPAPSVPDNLIPPVPAIAEVRPADAVKSASEDAKPSVKPE